MPSLIFRVLNDRSYNELFASEYLRGEKIHGGINWILYPVLLLMSVLTYLFQDNETVGAFGMGLVGMNIFYNLFLWYFIHKQKPMRVLSYIMMQPATLLC